jgi:hypothetical protein
MCGFDAVHNPTGLLSPVEAERECQMIEDRGSRMGDGETVETVQDNPARF